MHHQRDHEGDGPQNGADGNGVDTVYVETGDLNRGGCIGGLCVVGHVSSLESGDRTVHAPARLGDG
ncbi:MAG: hypothetical protein NTZ03_12020 [Actinobacteria bacterium]|nr:hypothetical protein [Actinomycetota bacterium]